MTALAKSWIADGTGGGFYYVMDATDTHVIAQIPVPIHSIPWTKERALEHRCLIAAAPELLAAVKRLAQEVEFGGASATAIRAMLQDAHAAIQKAEARSNG